MIVLRLICSIHVYYLNGTDQSTLLCAVMKSTCMCGSVGKLKLIKMLIYDKVQELLVLKINDQLMKYRDVLHQDMYKENWLPYRFTTSGTL